MKQEVSFQRRIYKVVKRIPLGKILTYKEVAERTGHAQAWRAVGNVLAKNRNPQIPCHRVIRSNGQIGNYNRGVKEKLRLLKKEGITFDIPKVEKF
ncbi:MGMT family protein [Patescibacteria group bacterium]|nr:MGMT family protein [Patescibacteria group bacterium]